MKTIHLFVITSILLASCASGPSLTGPIKLVENGDLDSYWKEIANNSTVGSMEFRQPDGKCLSFTKNLDKQSKSFVEYSYSIDSNGKAFDHRYVSKTEDINIPENQLSFLAVTMLLPRYEAAESNRGRSPVRLNYRMYLDDRCGRTQS